MTSLCLAERTVLSSLHHRLAGEDVDFDTAIFATASSGRVVSDRLVATLTLDLHTRRRDTLTSEERADACSAVVREGVVHAVRTRVVGVTDDHQVRIAVIREVSSELTQGSL